MNDYPEFPESFLPHCPEVKEAKRNNEPKPEQAAQCAFSSAGLGLRCEHCRLHLTRPFLNHEVDREFLPLIEQYYEDVRAWEKQSMRNQHEHDGKAGDFEIPKPLKDMSWFEFIQTGCRLALHRGLDEVFVSSYIDCFENTPDLTSEEASLLRQEFLG